MNSHAVVNTVHCGNALGKIKTLLEQAEQDEVSLVVDDGSRQAEIELPSGARNISGGTSKSIFNKRKTFLGYSGLYQLHQ